MKVLRFAVLVALAVLGGIQLATADEAPLQFETPGVGATNTQVVPDAATQQIVETPTAQAAAAPLKAGAGYKNCAWGSSSETVSSLLGPMEEGGVGWGSDGLFQSWMYSRPFYEMLGLKKESFMGQEDYDADKLPKDSFDVLTSKNSAGEDFALFYEKKFFAYGFKIDVHNKADYAAKLDAKYGPSEIRSFHVGGSAEAWTGTVKFNIWKSGDTNIFMGVDSLKESRMGMVISGARMYYVNGAIFNEIKGVVRANISGANHKVQKEKSDQKEQDLQKIE